MVVHDDLEVLVVENAELELSFLPQVGGRLISLRHGTSEVLWRNPSFLTASLEPVKPHASWPEPDATMGSWANVGGSKTWPAPQGWSGPHEWPGPPDLVLHFGAYEPSFVVVADGSAEITLTSAPDTRTGLQISRFFSVPRSGSAFSQVPTFTNCSDVPVRWSVWDVTQIDASLGGWVSVDVAAASAPLQLLNVVGVASWIATNGSVDVPVQRGSREAGLPGATGRARYLRPDGMTVSLRIVREPKVPYPDGGCPIEIWLQYPLAEPLSAFSGFHPTAHLVEIELLSPLLEIPAAGTVSLDVNWHLSR